MASYGTHLLVQINRLFLARWPQNRPMGPSPQQDHLQLAHFRVDLVPLTGLAENPVAPACMLVVFLETPRRMCRRVADWRCGFQIHK